ncbi:MULTISPECIES: ABC transporter ATP-binding protein [Romboutsia]|uniref:Lipid A export ATP-binding/permease protein MsbA n=1 Tax=Romboutsia hominis TaxID=1507512 RepID=A0A2P2BNE1_9FIRM|nr:MULTISPECIES: ABC transporter ATP-binding protein [Romboutsia]MDB8793042.1 ABC transporter ATP-binding protein [Romboutsia sp. 1001216sp1]MDB8795835.1 ABC transporter ATP-binding protein [Romboutsia sp. 1001216sp1]MDB8799330.1 ABC transporter ATP-binding protein [Romboutsia sp. 1001216sp1]CEI71893.1 Lipid A export ATP-binding/permease protein MsbA [Romboutsia hominis]
MSVKKSKRPMRMGGGPSMMAGSEKAKDFKGTMKKLLNRLSPYKVSLIFVVLFAIGSAVFTIVGPKILGNATTEIFEGLVSKVSGSGSGIDFTSISKTLAMLVGLYVISALFSFVQTFVTSDISQKVSYNLRKEISEKINKLPLKYFDGTTNGEVLSRVTNDVDAISQNLNQILSQMITAATVLIGVLVMMLSISVSMTLVTLVIIPLALVFISIVVKKSQKHFKDQQEYLGHTNGHIEEIYSGHNIMKAFNGEEKAIEEFNELNNTLYNSAWKSQALSGMMMPIMTFIGNLGYVMVAIMGGYLTIKKKIEVGDILSFIQYVRSFMQPIAQTAQIANVMQQTAAAAERVFEFLSEDEEMEETKTPVSTENIKGEVEFENVNFGYSDDKIIINDFSIKIKSGQKVAIVGPTGAGKTTIVKLLMRFYELNSGKILIDGHDIKEFTRRDLRNLFGMVLQDTWLFNGSIMDNIRYGNLKASDEEVIKAAKLAHADHFIKTLSDGYNMEINEEANNISQGQKQLLTIARAILADPKILILDEATSSVDTRTEVLIQQAMENLMEGRTSFIIAHRLSTIRNADLILVMKDGDIVEQGSHDELLKEGGFYSELYNSQFEEVEAC